MHSWGAVVGWDECVDGAGAGCAVNQLLGAWADWDDGAVGGAVDGSGAAVVGVEEFVGGFGDESVAAEGGECLVEGVGG